ncbi:MAG: DUF4276 family protein [Candidatus Latescibacteria bacterium]|nr:DUF4276 family protein [Candidatus Latescibacterota bacterium]
MKLGFVFECGPEGPDVKVCLYLLKMLDDTVETAFEALTNKPGLINDCGRAAKNLIEIENCDKVIVVWDLFPAWREKGQNPCRKEDREAIAEAMKNAGISKKRYEMVCIEEELEAWLISDERVLRKFISRKIHPHPVGNIKKIKNPEGRKNPKTWLTKLFNREIGGRRKYNDIIDAEHIVKGFEDFNRIRNSATFRRFALKTVGRKL